MSKEDEMHTGGILKAYLAGAITGAAVALLWAPTSGTETRRVVSEKARESSNKATVAARQGRELVLRRADHMTKAVNRGREAYREALKGSQESAELIEEPAEE